MHEQQTFRKRFAVFAVSCLTDTPARHVLACMHPCGGRVGLPLIDKAPWSEQHWCARPSVPQRVGHILVGIVETLANVERLLDAVGSYESRLGRSC